MREGRGGPAVPRRVPAWWSPWSAPGATLVYTVLALAFTWPLVTALHRSLPWDNGDPALNSWILAWSADHLLRFVTGHPDAFANYWNANIFHPEPLALAYSEHLFAQALQVLPAWALTRNPILCYNLVLLSTYVLSALGTFLLVRDLTGDPRAAFVAGVAFGFAPYRIAQLSHVQVLSAQWMPFALYALRRHLTTGRPVSLVGFAAALLLQNLSCGYYILYFGPFVAIYALVEMVARRFPRSGATMAGAPAAGQVPNAWTIARVGTAFAGVAAATWPFLAPYLELRRLGFPPRQLEEVVSFSANTWGWAQAAGAQWLWGGRVAAFAKPEGELFPGFMALALAAYAGVMTIRTAWRASSPVPSRRWAGIAAAAALLVMVGSLGVLVVSVFRDEPSLRVAGVLVHARIGRTLRVLAWAAVVLLVMSPRAREAAGRLARAPAAWYLVSIVIAAVLSCGPFIEAGPRTVIDHAPYRWLYAHAPGFDGLRVPARYAMLVELGLAVLCGYAVSMLPTSRRSGVAAVACAAALLLEGGASPLPLDRPYAAQSWGMATTPGSLPQAASPPAVYAFVSRLPRDTVLTELPFGSEAWDIRYVFASTLHWRRLVNGYSGGFPVSYYANLAALLDVFRNPDAAWTRLRRTGTTHVIVHEAVYLERRGPAVTAWLVSRGARPVARFGSDVVLRMPAAALK